MDDRYLCRGKRNDDLRKDWVTGHYVSVPRHMIVLAETMLSGNWNCFDVDPATVGQCTGLRDCNGKLIFEGDIVKKCLRKGVYYSCEIVWSGCGFERRGQHGLHPIHENDVEIIGNKWDNPELLEGPD